MSDFKLAAEALRTTAMWQQRALEAEAKVAKIDREKRVASLSKQAESKGIALPKDVDFSKCSESTLADYERVVGMVDVAKGTLKLAEEEPVEGRPAQSRSNPLDDWLSNPNLRHELGHGDPFGSP